MARRFAHIAGAALLWCWIAGGATAATLVVEDGRLKGVLGLTVGFHEYDVEFLGGTCIGLFECDDLSDFTFQTERSAKLAAKALTDFALQDTAAGNFRSEPGLINGCSVQSNKTCLVLIPFRIYPNDPVIAAVTIMQDYTPNSSVVNRFTDITGMLFTWARFSGEKITSDTQIPFDPDPTPVPLPGAMGSLLLGLFATSLLTLGGGRAKAMLTSKG